MNANEVIADARRRRRAPQRPREHGAVLQRRLPLRRPPRRPGRGDQRACCPRSSALEAAFAAKAEEFHDIVKAGRTHLMDAVPVTLGQEFAGYAAQIRLGARRVRNALPQVAQIPLGGTATGTGLNTHPEFAERVRALLAERDRPGDPPARGPLRGAGQPRRAGRAVGRAEGRRRLADQDRQRPRVDGLRPARRHRRDLLPELQKGSSIMPGQGQPGDPRGRAAGRRPGDRQRHRDHRRRLAGQLRAQRAHPADRAQPARVDPPARPPCRRCFAEKCVEGIEANLEGCERSAESTLAVATALNPFIGYDKAAEIVKEAAGSGRTLREVAREHGVDEETLDKALDLRKIAAGSQAGSD